MERQVSDPVLPPPQEALNGISWQSWTELRTDFGHRFYMHQPGTIEFVRAERSAGNGSSAAYIDVLLNNLSLFPSGRFPAVAAQTALGSEYLPERVAAFDKGDSFQCNVVSTGGGDGPLRVTIKFRNELQDQPKQAS